MIEVTEKRDKNNNLIKKTIKCIDEDSEKYQKKKSREETIQKLIQSKRIAESNNKPIVIVSREELSKSKLIVSCSREEIRKMADALIKFDSSRYDPNSYTNTPDLPEYLIHKGYGFEIKKVPNRSGSNTYTVLFQGDIVYDEKNDYFKSTSDKFIHGAWEEVLREYYNKLPVLIQKREAKKVNDKKCEDLYWNLINKLGKKKFNDHIEITETTEDIYSYNKTVTRVIYNQQVVYCREWYNPEPGYGLIRTEYTTYIPGEWELELIRLKQEKDYQREQAKKQKTLSYLDQIKKI